MHYDDLEIQMWDKQRTMLRDADSRRLVAIAQTRPDARRRAAQGRGVLAAVADGFRSLLAPRTSRIEHPGLGDAS